MADLGITALAPGQAHGRTGGLQRNRRKIVDEKIEIFSVGRADRVAFRSRGRAKAVQHHQHDLLKYVHFSFAKKLSIAEPLLCTWSKKSASPQIVARAMVLPPPATAAALGRPVRAANKRSSASVPALKLRLST